MSTTKLHRLLVVDDDPVVGTSFNRVLSGKGYAVVTAHDGEEALRKIAAEEYDAVFTDIRMPGIDGIAVAEQIRAQRPWLPVVIVSGYATAENELRARAAGVTTILHKPLSPQMIEDGARDALLEHAAMALAPATPPVEVTSAAAAPAVAPAFALDTAPAASPQTTVALPGMRLSEGQAMLAAPFITLGFVLLFPVIFLATLVAVPVWHFAKWLMARPTTEFTRWSRDVGLFFAAPFLGLAYIILGPFVALACMVGMLGNVAWKGLKSALAGRDAA